MLIYIFIISTFQVFVKELAKYQGIKTRKQLIKDANIVGKCFSGSIVSDMNRVRSMEDYDVFKYKEGDELIASVYLNRNIYYKQADYLFTTGVEEVKAVEIYSLWVNDKYRGKGISRRLLYDALMTIREEYDYGNDFVVGLHINEADPYMNISFALYYSMNFRKCCFVNYGPDEIKSNFSKFYDLKNPLRAIFDPNSRSEEGIYLAMYTTMNQILFFNPIRNKKLKEIGELLRDELRRRKASKKD
ncbi:hypothetical protein NGRA_0331 [Nosema granulosis]|uniref:N-acetyltransferase domain-containing protein n=1 Tax=Nosema granulosis TaxID=83296 RepID=A0A9P6L054_9MICR|nr:hypothetical protein NGRA_0331 [Nosema granulosis]